MNTTSAEQDATRLLVEHVVKDYDTPGRPLSVLRDVSLTLSSGQTLAVVGPSGCGKSTLLNIIGALDKPTSGTVKLGDEEVTRLAGRELATFRCRRVGFVFQEHHLLPQCTALQNVALPTLAAGAPKKGQDRAGLLLERVGLADRMHAFPAELSGGERQRVATARAMVNDPALLLCDEPTGNLDNDTADRIVSLFIELVEERDTLLIVVTHNLRLAGRFSRRMELRDGVVHPLGSASSVRP